MTNLDINIELIYPKPNEQILVSLTVSAGTTVLQAIEKSNILITYPEINFKINKVGIFSKVTKLNEVLRDGDRIEIYRPLIADPKEVRKKKAAKNI